MAEITQNMTEGVINNYPYWTILNPETGKPYQQEDEAMKLLSLMEKYYDNTYPGRLEAMEKIREYFKKLSL